MGSMGTLGQRLMASRIEAGYRRPEDFAALVGKSSRQVREYEKDNVAPPLAVLRRWAEETNKPMGYFVEEVQVRMGTATGQAAPDHVGVKLLAADSALCRAHHIAPEELQELASLVLIRRGQAVSLQTAQEALQVLQSLRTLGPP